MTIKPALTVRTLSQGSNTASDRTGGSSKRVQFANPIAASADTQEDRESVSSDAPYFDMMTAFETSFANSQADKESSSQSAVCLDRSQSNNSFTTLVSHISGLVNSVRKPASPSVSNNEQREQRKVANTSCIRVPKHERCIKVQQDAVFVEALQEIIGESQEWRGQLSHERLKNIRVVLVSLQYLLSHRRPCPL
jgi:hypothetical protein